MSSFFRIVSVMLPLLLTIILWAFGTVRFVKRYRSRNYSQSRLLILGWMWSDIIEAFRLAKMYSVVPKAAIFQMAALLVTILMAILWSLVD